MKTLVYILISFSAIVAFTIVGLISFVVQLFNDTPQNHKNVILLLNGKKQFLNQF